MLHSLMPRMLRKTGEKPKATMALHQIDVGKRVRQVLHRFKSESRTRKTQQAIKERIALVGKNADGTEPKIDENDVIVHTHEDEYQLTKRSHHPLIRKDNNYNRIS